MEHSDEEDEKQTKHSNNRNIVASTEKRAKKTGSGKRTGKVKGKKRILRPTRARRVIYKFPSVKNRRQMVVEEWLEMRFCYFLEYDPSVLCYQCQPEQFSVFFGDKEHKYGPDFRVFFKEEGQRQLFVEAKPTRWMNTRRVKQIERYFRSHIEEIGDFRYWNETHASTPLIDNLQKIYPYTLFPLRPDLEIHVLARLSLLPETISIADFVADFVADDSLSPQILLPIIYALIFSQRISCDLNSPITRDSIISHPCHKEVRVG